MKSRKSLMTGLGALSIFLLGACIMDSRMTDHHGYMGTASGQHSADMASGSGMMGMHNGESMPTMDTAMAVECLKMMGSGTRDHH